MSGVNLAGLDEGGAAAAHGDESRGRPVQRPFAWRRVTGA